MATSPDEAANIAIARRWLDLYNGDDREAFVATYHPNFAVTLYDGVAFDGSETSIDDRDAFLGVEKQLKAECPGRRCTIERILATGDTVIIEALCFDDDRPEFRVPWCGILTLKEGLVLSEHMYLNHQDWPGLVKTLEQQASP